MIGIIIIIAGPLLLFSTVNPIATPNPVLGGSMRFAIKVTPQDASIAPTTYNLIVNPTQLSIEPFPKTLYDAYKFGTNENT